MECYICTDITTEISPCVCKTPVHETCLNQWIEKSKSTTCSICKTKLIGFQQHIHENEYIEINNAVHQNNIRIMIHVLLWFICGYVGKAILALIINPSFLLISSYWSPLDIVFFVLATFLYIIMKHILITFKYLRSVRNIQYDEFEDNSDSDIDNEGDIV